MRSRERREEVVQRDVIGNVCNRHPERDSLVLLLREQVVDARPKIENMVGSNPRRIVIVILGACCRNVYARRADVGIITIGVRQLAIGCGSEASTEEPDGRLLGRS